MKFTPEHLDTLRTALTPLDTDAVRDRARAGDFPNAERVKNPDRYYRWQLLWAATRGPHADALRAVIWADDSTYNDAHIDTALRAVVPPL